MRNKKWVGCILLSGILLLLCSCGSKMPETAAEILTDEVNLDAVQETSSYPYTFTDSAGNEITLEKRPENVAVLFSSYVDLWQCAGGETEITVGESVKRGFSAQDATLVDEGTGHELDTEALIAAEPDFVIGTMDYEAQMDACSFCNEHGIPAAAFQVESFEDYLHVLEIFTSITGDKDALKVNGTAVKEQIETLKERVPMDQNPVSILFIRAGSSDKYTKAKTADNHFVCAMLKELNTYNIAEDVPVLLDALSLEEILVKDPEYIFISLMGNEDAAKEYIDGLLAQDGWKDLSAVKEGKCILLSKELFQYKPNARWAEAYELLINTMYPEE